MTRYRPCAHSGRPKVALGKCQDCWTVWRRNHTDNEIREALARECSLCRKPFAPLNPKRYYCCEECRMMARRSSPLEHRYVLWTEVEYDRIKSVYLRHGFERVGPKTTPGTPNRPYIAAWLADPPGCYVIRASKLEEELSQPPPHP